MPRRWLAASGVALLVSMLAAAPASADCQPDPASTGQTVTCSGVDNNGFSAGVGVNQLTVNVLTGAAVNNLVAGSTAINLNDTNVVTNNGAVNAGDDGTGISAGSGNTITNASSGTITIGNAVSGTAFGIVVVDGNIVTNFGSIQLGTTTCGCGVVGISANNNNTITNVGSLSGGDLGVGIQVGDNNTVSNRGVLSFGRGSAGISGNNNNSVVNTAGGVIAVGNSPGFGAFGIIVFDNNTVTNLGTIQVGSTLFGAPATGISVGDGNTVLNAAGATITAGRFGVGIQAGDGNGLTNDGFINVGRGGAGVLLGSGNSFTNNGTVRVGAGGASIASCGSCTQDDVVVNNGTLDGQIALLGTSHSLANNGLITVTDPGTPVGVQHAVDGSFLQGASGTLALRVTPDTTPGAYDALSIHATTPTDTAALGGTLKAVIQPGLYQSTQTYTNVVTFCSCFGGALIGSFGGVVSSSAFFNATATYGPNNVDLTLNRIPFGSVAGETQNQRHVGNYLEQNYSTGLTGNAAIFFSNLLTSPSLGVLDKLSGEGTSGSQQAGFNAGGMFNKVMLDQVLSFLDGGTAGTSDFNRESTLLQYAAVEKAKPPEYKAFAAIRPPTGAFEPHKLRAWMTAFGGSQAVRGDPVIGSADASNRTFGAAGGFDYQVSPNLLVGFAAAGTSSDFSAPDRATTGSLDGAHLGVYGVYRWGAAYLAGTLSYGHFNNDTFRTVNGVGPTEIARGRFASDQFGGRLQAGYKFAFGRFAITPFAAVQYLQLWQRGYAEASFTSAGAPGILGLTFQSRAVSSLPTFLGAQVDTRIAFPYGVSFAPFVRASWVHEFMPDRSIAAALGILPTGTFIVDGPRAAGDAARIEAGGHLYVTRNVAFFGNFVGEYSGSTSSNAGNGGLRVTW